MEENNKFETNADGSGSESVLYGAKPQPEEESGYSSVYGTELQETTLVQQAESSKSESQSATPVQLTKSSESVPHPQEQFYQHGNGLQQGQNPYSQPSSGSQPGCNNQPVNSGQMGYGPMQVPPLVQGAPASKPKKNKAGVIVGILCAAAVLLVIAAGVLLSKLLLGGNAEQQLAKGIANMAKEMTAYQSSIASDMGMEELVQLKDIAPIHTNVDLSFTDPSASGSLSSIAIEVDAVVDYKKKLAEFDLGAGAYGFSMDVGKLVAADNVLYVSVPMVFEEVYSLDLTNLGRDFNQSVWSDIIGETIPEDYSLTLFPETGKTDSNDQSDKKDTLLEIFLGKNSTRDDSVQYETIKQKRTFTFGGTSAEYGGVRVTVNKDAYNESVAVMRDEFLASDTYKNIMKGYEASYSGDFDEFKEYMDEFVEMIFGLRFEQDFVLDFYLDKKGRIVNISTPEDVAVSNSYTEFEFLAVDIDFAGTERTLDSIEGGIYVQSGDEIVYMGISRTAAMTESSYNEDLTLCIQSDADDDEITIGYKNDWGYDDHSFDGELMIAVPDSSIGIRADGSFTDIVQGVGYTFRIDHSAIIIDGEDLLLMTGSIMTEPADDTIEVPDDAVNILDMSEADIVRLLYGYSSLY